MVLTSIAGASEAAEGECWIDPVEGTLQCHDSGIITDPGLPGLPPPVVDDPGLRYVYITTDPVIGDCHYWSDVPGGLDAWDPANDPAVIAAVTALPECPAVPALDPEVRAWEVFRSWDLDPPEPDVSPEAFGITGVDTHIAAVAPPAILHTEVLPDGRLLDVRARVAQLDVDWGDGVLTSHDADDAAGYPDGSVTHVYDLKTCSAEYRAGHPSGGLCHPTLEYYTITVTHTWVGEYRIGGGGAWTALGALNRPAAITYDVDEARGFPVVGAQP